MEIVKVKALAKRMEEDNETWEILFPDLLGGYECADDSKDIYKALQNIAELLCVSCLEQYQDIPEPSEINDDEILEYDIIKYIEVDLDYAKKSVISYNTDGSLKYPNQKELQEYYNLCEEKEVDINEFIVRQIVSRM